MNINYIYDRLCEILDKEDILLNEPMKNHTSFKVGGPADILVMPREEKQIVDIINLVKQNNIPFFIMGNGSNLLVKDKGIRGVVIKIAENYSDFEIKENVVKAKAGILLSRLAKNILKAELEGFEFASGIPGSLGGAIAMNAGAYGGEMKDVVTSVKLLDTDGNIIELNNEQMEFGYRKSILSYKDFIVLEVTMTLKKGKYEDIKSIIDDITVKRTTKQPLNLPSAGSTFKRPEGYFAAKLIEDAGLKGLTFKDAQVSPKHCGFVVNLGNASANDILHLISIIKKTVKDKFDVLLEEEVKIVGED
ncbi:UDP-N-acetylmuramate dehydrogenase [Alkalithermobacter thermoalcaliphilus JW-YL-7 = DSM 7308]|uniref:UDP-N-acetylenolpyruvoylglucosamine reductase n=1 Tax=Alkalithermobacter thermoalcaliphilus JW-YL-7 = DSM 7308 TaxID=1121328 RepID=A0A150FS66_CLOPD|nr:UDP-N-acetylenolpyruvoylglucosamine reductase [[Clostridium] paradoxum JW-YL-7 = DSM 7308]SHL15705.1 UDP-N-acetylmuramate dehydrogenase [[Clostridium] paradoxum JW-YL-7 = DSM 7308]